MRLQLAIQRHGLPIVRILWNVGNVNASQHVNSSLTVSRFLEQLNEIIPLEADYWGLEDYAVEVGGFECLHFFELAQILREDDVVLIRALQTSDIRKRKFSGRHQINADGKHLIDGIAFGRPYLQKPHRPEIRIPPRKRQKIAHEELEEPYVDANYPHDLLTIGKTYLSAGNEEGYESWEDEDATDDTGEDSNIEDELEDLHQELYENNQLESSARASDQNDRRITRAQSKGSGLEVALPYFGPYYNPLLDEYCDDEPSVAPESEAASGRRSKRRELPASRQKNAEVPVANTTKRRRQQQNTQSNRVVRFEDEEVTTPATVLLTETWGDEDDDDGDFHPPEEDGSDKENTWPGASPDVYPGEQHDSSSSSSFVPSDSASVISEDEPSAILSNSVRSSSALLQKPGSGLNITLEDSQEPISLAPDKPPGQPMGSQAGGNQGTDTASTGKNKIILEDLPGPEARSTMSPPSCGKKATKKRNERKRASKTLKRLKKSGLLPQDAKLTDLGSRNQVLIAKPMTEATEGENSDSNAMATAFEVRRQALLDHIASKSSSAKEDPKDPFISEIGEDERQADATEKINDSQVGKVPETVPEDHDQDEKEVQEMEEENSDASTNEIPDSLPIPRKDVSHSGHAHPPVAEDSIATHSKNDEPQPRRSRLDLASTKRMLFGSLGLRTPKTKEDEIALREKLRLKIKPISKEQTRPSHTATNGSDTVEIDESWRDKIDLRAVECCHEEVKLSTPPFPFIQRWDPQQQVNFGTSRLGNKNRNRKRKRSQHRVPNEETEGTSMDTHAFPQNGDHWMANPEDSEYYANDPIHNFGPHIVHEAQIPTHQETYDQTDVDFTQLGTQHQDMEEDSDLPALPTDLSTYPELQAAACKDKTIIAFKRFLMSAETNWQPRISEYVTGIVQKLETDGTLYVSLAKRDRVQQNARFDQDTGQRIYDKFEMPGFDEAQAMVGEGQLEIPFNELIDPRLIQPSDLGTSGDQHNPNKLFIGASNAEDSHTKGLPEANSKGSPKSRLHGEDTESPDFRGRIMQLIQDSGWRSSLDSNVSRQLKLPSDDGSQQGTKEQSQHEPGEGQVEGTLVSSEPPPEGLEELQSVRTPNTLQPQMGSHNIKIETHTHSHQTAEDPGLVPTTNDNEFTQQHSQHPSVSPRIAQPVIPIGSISPPLLRGRIHNERSPQTPTLERQAVPHALASIDGTAESEDEFPELFSRAFQARLSQEPKIKDEASPHQNLQRIPKTRSKTTLAARTRSSRKSNLKSSQPESPPGHIAMNGDGGATRKHPKSHPEESSQVIDLTLSSEQPELFDRDDDKDDSSYHPGSSPGWVDKPEINESIGLASRKMTKSRIAGRR